jgi:hypothetical protein
VVVGAGWPSYSAILLLPCWEKLGGFPFFALAGVSVWTDDDMSKDSLRTPGLPVMLKCRSLHALNNTNVHSTPSPHVKPIPRLGVSKQTHVTSGFFGFGCTSRPEHAVHEVAEGADDVHMIFRTV